MHVDNETATKILFGLYVLRNKSKDNEVVSEIIKEMISLLETSLGVKD